MQNAESEFTGFANKISESLLPLDKNGITFILTSVWLEIICNRSRTTKAQLASEEEN